MTDSKLVHQLLSATSDSLSDRLKLAPRQQAYLSPHPPNSDQLSTTTPINKWDKIMNHVPRNTINLHTSKVIAKLCKGIAE
ncbi:hypothetical protein PtA15_7A250 [Puccinia triticina]|uniref:Uncharacterized protein n=1 Tax=Puccinia triticina TaxID=208348 RepID=A0ABY7CMX2_9BASI|nr:uncharacterized protein PtA15_7A250 [Puccinia triticina]WAQ86524.1 hypothetical protein PtA15_7A250 [Puccinia triticina]